MTITTIRSAADHLAAELSTHLRIRTLIISGEGALASTLLRDRMVNLCNDFAAGERVECGDCNIALNIMTASYGPQASLEMRLRAMHLIDTLTAQIKSLL